MYVLTAVCVYRPTPMQRKRVTLATSVYTVYVYMYVCTVCKIRMSLTILLQPSVL